MVLIKLSWMSFLNKLIFGLIEILLWIGTILKNVNIHTSISKKNERREIQLNEYITSKKEAIASMIIVGPAIKNIVLEYFLWKLLNLLVSISKNEGYVTNWVIKLTPIIIRLEIIFSNKDIVMDN